MQRSHFLIAILAAGVVGCAATTMNDVIAEKRSGGGTSRVYPIPPGVAFEVSRDVLRTRGGEAIEEHASEGFMLTGSGANELTRGTLVGVWVAPAGEQTMVTVVTKRKLPNNVVTTLTESGFHEYFAQMLAGRNAKAGVQDR